jgi:hypothetical protein
MGRRPQCALLAGTNQTIASWTQVIKRGGSDAGSEASDDEGFDPWVADDGSNVPIGGCFTGQHSATGTRTRVALVRAEYPNQLDYSGF